MKRILHVFIWLVFSFTANAKGYNINIKSPEKDRSATFWICNGIEGALLQIGSWQDPAFKNSAGNTIDLKSIPRFSYFFNSGADINYQLVKGFSVFTGLNLKNIGMIVKLDTVKYKHRVYTLGLPLGIRIHKANHKTWFKAGMDFSWALNYKMKTFEDGKSKVKYSSWFSQRVASFYPSVFVGLNVSGISFGSNFYLQNFFNDKSAATNGYKANLMTVGLGLNMSKKGKVAKNKKKETTTM